MTDKTLPEMIWDELTAQVKDLQAQVHTIEVRTERGETSSGHPTATVATAPLAGNGVKGGDELWLSDGRKSGEAAGAGTGVLAFYDPATNTWIPFAGIFPRRWFGKFINSTVLTGAAIAIVIFTTQVDNHVGRQNPSANGDSFTQSFLLAAGTYTFQAIGLLNPDSGKLDWYLDNVLIATGDEFNGVSTPNTIFTHTVVVPYSGYHVLKGVVNGSTSGTFVIRLTTLAFIPSVD